MKENSHLKEVDWQPLFDGDPNPLLPKLSASRLKVLRLVKAGDPYRDKAPGKRGRVGRLQVIGYLRLRNLIRNTRQGLLRVTPAGLEMLERNPVRKRRRG
jgi:hypothetical protein